MSKLMSRFSMTSWTACWEAGIEVVPATAKSAEEVSDDAKEQKPHSDPLIAETEDEDQDERDALLRVLKKDLTSDAGYQAALDTDDVVGLYLKEAGRVPLLTANEEVMLAKRMEAAVFANERLEKAAALRADELTWSEEQQLRGIVFDGEKAQEHLIRANARLVISVAKKYIGRGVPFLDLIQEGNIGFDPRYQQIRISAGATSSAPTLPGGSAKRSAAPSPTRGAPFACPFTWAIS